MDELERLLAAIDDKAEPRLRALKKRIENGSATAADTAELTRIYAEITGQTLSAEVLGLTDREAVTTALLRRNYERTNSAAAKIQRSIDSKSGIGLQPVTAAFPAERVRQFAHSLTDPTVPDETIRRRARSGSENITMSFNDDYVRANAEYRSSAGLDAYIVRTDGAGCCKWCAALAGKFKYPDEIPDDVFRRHDNCTCDVSYVSSKGRQNVHTKKWTQVNEPRKIEYTKPAKLTRAEAQAREAEILEQRRLTYDEKRGIFKNIELPPETDQIRSMSEETKKLISDAFDKITREYDIRYDELVTEELDKENKNVPFQFQPIRGENGELIKRFVINSNYDFMGSQANFQERILRNYNNGILASNSIEGLISHELAHIMTFQDTATFSGYLFENKKISKKMVYGISRYADTSNDGAECIAEAFAAKRCGSILSEEAQALLDEYIERWHKT